MSRRSSQMHSTSSTTIFLDRDGVINQKPPEGQYVRSPHEFKFRPGALEALGLLSEAGKRLIVVTNQRGVALGHISLADIAEIHAWMLDHLLRAGVRCDAIYYCPHDIGACGCRKPGIELLLQARRDFPDIEFSRSALVGDSLSDMEAGTRVGCATLLVAPARRTPRLLGEAARRRIRIDGTGRSLLEVTRRHLAGSPFKVTAS